jgi:hypothetical protein
MALDLDFVRDVTAIFRARIVALGYQVAPGLTDEDVRIRYLNLKHRLVPPRPRALHRAANFACPPDMQRGLALVEGKITRGGDLRPHMSRGLVKIDYSDALLNDWGIHHFHLGTTIASDGFAARTGPLLFARITRDDAYLIDVKAHGAWSSQDLLRQVYANWPDTMDRFRICGIIGLAYAPGNGPPTDAEIGQMRRAGVVVPHELAPGAVYMPPGGGYATDGTSISVVRENDALVRQLRDVEIEVGKFEQRLRADLQRDNAAPLPDLVVVRLNREKTGDLVAIVGDAIAAMTVGALELI